VYRQIEGEDGQKFPDFGSLSEKWDQGGEYVAVYPNVLLGVQRDHAFAILLQPVSKDRTLETVKLYYADETAVGSEFDDLRAKNAGLWQEVFEEDVFVIEGMQNGRHAPMFDGGKFSPAMDGPTHCFHHWVALQIEQGRAGG
jgi:phenylpropionate dioxygenase-like ring-hydroxylating dioxygenase large terminal subunit